ncbi:NRAMP family divalent metal transporter [Sedimentibacter sp. MB31-C6]|uniref:NRAMP family divalent metal transporter n=1 Tax=Sedimentibacter sp. MB31-C6 TaxID=3109366 RepID=UPI002DDD55BF|nr:NRAMP family divalent metal transporter [Sedimentibacter sp. MB36-C1]WSI05582.1 NRAMP family divalent metal transporter [Sedimentibacter sp. MB36-C1]
MGKKSNIGVLLGAAFLMATSAIGPGFLTQTAAFTEQYQASFGFAILISIILTIGVQLNIWRIIGVSGMRGQDIANKVLPGLGYFIAFLVALGGLVFNMGNVGGAALGLNVLFGIDISYGAIIGGVIGICIFLSKNAKSIVDKLTNVLGIIMILLAGYVAIVSKPPVTEAVVRTFNPVNLKDLIFPIITLLGGTVGGYITFSGGHRLIDAGITGEENLSEVNKSAGMGIGVASIMRVLFFLAILGVVSKGNALDPGNPAADAFLQAAGPIGYKFFGIVLFSAAISSVIGAAYTSVSFLKTLNKTIEKYENYFIIGFIAISSFIMAFLGQPAKLLILAGSVNGLILPITLATVLLASRKKEVVGESYKHPTWLIIFGIIIVIVTAYAGFNSLTNITKLFM